MFLKISEFKKAMKSALKTTGGLYVGNLDDHYLVYTSFWGIYVESTYATNKFKAAIMELIGDMPDEETCYKYYIEDKKLQYAEGHPGKGQAEKIQGKWHSDHVRVQRHHGCPGAVH